VIILRADGSVDADAGEVRSTMTKDVTFVMEDGRINKGA
jgi:hypothetical protein